MDLFYSQTMPQVDKGSRVSALSQSYSYRLHSISFSILASFLEKYHSISSASDHLSFDHFLLNVSLMILMQHTAPNFCQQHPCQLLCTPPFECCPLDHSNVSYLLYIPQHILRMVHHLLGFLQRKNTPFRCHTVEHKGKLRWDIVDRIQ